MTAAHRLALVGLVAAMLAAVPALADDPVFTPDTILGVWETEHTDTGWSHVEIYEEGGKIHGRIIWLKNPLYDAGEGVGVAGEPRVDLKNPEEGLRDRPILGLALMEGFAFNGANKWEDGRVYDPENGKTYRGKLTLKDRDTLELFGYVKVGFVNVGRNTTWTRVVDPNSPGRS